MALRVTSLDSRVRYRLLTSGPSATDRPQQGSLMELTDEETGRVLELPLLRDQLTAVVSFLRGQEVDPESVCLDQPEAAAIADQIHDHEVSRSGRRARLAEAIRRHQQRTCQGDPDPLPDGDVLELLRDASPDGLVRLASQPDAARFAFEALQRQLRRAQPAQPDPVPPDTHPVPAAGMRPIVPDEYKLPAAEPPAASEPRRPPFRLLQAQDEGVIMGGG